MQLVKRDYCRNFMTAYCYLIVNLRYFLIMDEKDVYLNYALNRTVHQEGEKPVSITVNGSSSMRFTHAVTIATDGSKLPLLVIFKGTPGGNAEISLISMLPDCVFGCLQPKAWIDNGR